ncbi:MAG TPA: hypothetical protein VIQ62_05650, partial [Burkholderiales bacterium]
MKNLIDRLFLCLTACALLQAPHAGAAAPRAPVVLDRIVAVVNDEVITRVELEDRMKVAVRQLQQ